MYRFAVFLVLLLHALYVSSGYVVTMMSPADADAQFKIFSCYILVYCLSLYSFGYVRYILVIPYVLICYRVAIGIFSIPIPEHYFFFFSCLVMCVLSLFIVYNLIFGSKLCILDSFAMRGNVFFYALFLAVAAYPWALFRGETENPEFIFLTLCLFLSFSVFLISPQKKVFKIAQIISIILLSIPYIAILLLANLFTIDIEYGYAYIVLASMLISLSVAWISLRH